MNCQSCNTPNNEASRFCSHCGRELRSAPSVVGYTALSNGAAAAPAMEPDSEVTRVRSSVAPNADATIVDGPAAHAAAANVTGYQLLGSVIEGKYRIDAKIGAGGMGSVYRARRLMIGDDVAVKILHPEHVSQPDATERFRREAQAAARLKHPNAVSIYDFGVTSGGLVYLVMELVEGQSLREIIKRQGPLTPSAAADVISQVCAALDEAHRQQIVHRDLKPDNIVVQPMINGLRVKVLDFGIAKLRDLTAGNLTQTGSVMGTPHYMSPEQCLGEELDSRSDIYSLGIVLFEMLAGAVPFNSPISTAVVVQHVNQAPPPLRAINVSISPAVEAVVMRALAKQRQERPQSAAALAEELRNAVSAAPSFAAQLAAPIPTSAPQMPSLSNAQPSVQAPTVVLRPPVPGAAFGAPTSPVPHAYTTYPHQPAYAAAGHAVSSMAPKVILGVVAGVFLLAAIIATAIALSGNSVEKKLDNAIARKNLFGPSSDNAYDLYNQLKSNGATEKVLKPYAERLTPLLTESNLKLVKDFQAVGYDEPNVSVWQDAARSLNWAAELNPDNSTIASRAAYCDGRVGFIQRQHDRALSFWSEAANLDKSWALPVNGLGMIYLDRRNYSKAAGYFSDAISREPNWPIPYSNMGSAYYQQKNRMFAKEFFNKALAKAPNWARPHMHLGNIAMEEDDYTTAIAEFETALSPNLIGLKGDDFRNINNSLDRARRLTQGY